MRIDTMYHYRGYSIIEALIAVAMASMIVVIVGSSLSATKRLYAASGNKEKALGYAREYLDLVHKNKDQAFACICSGPNPNGSCSGGYCSHPSQTNRCKLLTGYNSCWLEYPITAPSFGYYALNAAGQFIPYVFASAEFERSIDVQNLCRDNEPTSSFFGQLIACNPSALPPITSDYQSKKVTVTVEWRERGHDKTMSISEIFTAWKNIP